MHGRGGAAGGAALLHSPDTSPTAFGVPRSARKYSLHPLDRVSSAALALSLARALLWAAGAPVASVAALSGRRPGDAGATADGVGLGGDPTGEGGACDPLHPAAAPAVLYRNTASPLCTKVRRGRTPAPPAAFAPATLPSSQPPCTVCLT
jgi:hypothetical protein